MAKEHWGAGIRSEALKATLVFGYGALQLNRIWAKVDPDNMKTVLVLKRASWQFEGTLRQDVRVRGTLRDIRLFVAQEGVRHVVDGVITTRMKSVFH
jgi:RimJ/RimL family protein N-acetyltransferase